MEACTLFKNRELIKYCSLKIVCVCVCDVTWQINVAPCIKEMDCEGKDYALQKEV